MISKLPAAVEMVTVPDSFAPSSWQQLAACPMSVWARAEGVLPASVKALVGRVLHKTREIVLEANLLGPANTKMVRETVEAVRTREEQLVEASDERLGVPLVEAYGARRWLQRVLWLEAWARALPARSAMTSAPVPRGSLPRGDRFGLGAEPTWSVGALRLRGRPDEARLDAAGNVVVTDYKTGFVVRRDGQIAPGIEVQVQLYLLMAEELTGRQARGIVLGSESAKVPWDPALRDDLRTRVAEFGERFPAGARLAATEVARPGPHCIGCSLRPRCTSYLRQAPLWWPNTGTNPRPLPYDAWGEVRASEVERIGLQVRLEDSTGRATLVRGLDPARASAVSVGVEVFLFDLEATEDTVMHGRRVYPHAFHERSPGPRWPPAWRTRAFVG